MLFRSLEAEGAREINPSRQQLDLFSPVEVVEENPLKAEQEELLDEISQVNLNEKTPLEVMQLVADWQQALKEE